MESFKCVMSLNSIVTLQSTEAMAMKGAEMLLVMYELLMIIMSVLPVGLIPEMDHPGLFVVIVIIFQMCYTYH